MGPTIYVNGEPRRLLDDLRFPMLENYAPDFCLYDMRTTPATEVELCTDPMEAGVTKRKLLPNGHYSAYARPRSGGAYYTNLPPACLYVLNLPPTTTATMLGQFFEKFDTVQEADICQSADGQCNGRGWVTLRHPEMLPRIDKSLPFAPEFPNHYIFVEVSHHLPDRDSLMPPQDGLLSAPDTPLLGSMSSLDRAYPPVLFGLPGPGPAGAGPSRSPVANAAAAAAAAVSPVGGLGMVMGGRGRGADGHLLRNPGPIGVALPHPVAGYGGPLACTPPPLMDDHDHHHHHHLHHHHHHHHYLDRSHPYAALPPTTDYFVVHLMDDEAQQAVHDQSFIPNFSTDALMSAQADDVVLLFMVHHNCFFGAAHLLTRRRAMNGRCGGGERLMVHWILSHLYAPAQQEFAQETRTFCMVSGAALPPSLGERLLHFLRFYGEEAVFAPPEGVMMDALPPPPAPQQHSPLGRGLQRFSPTIGGGGPPCRGGGARGGRREPRPIGDEDGDYH